VDVVDPGIDNIIAVFREVAVYPTDVCLVGLAAVAIARPVALDVPARWMTVGLALLAGVALVSSLPSREPILGAALAGHVALLALAWLGVRSGHVSRRALVVALVASAAVQSVVALGQFTLQQTLVPPELRLPWLPSDPSGGGTPVVLSPAGDRLLRGFGTFPHPNILGGYLALALACLPVLTQGWSRRPMLWWLVGVVLVAGLLASFSRAAWLAALAGLGIWWWTSHRYGRAGWSLLGLVPLTVAVVALSPLAPTVATRVFPFGPDTNALERGSVENRLALDRSGVSEGFDHLPLGVGAGNYGVVAVAEGYQEGWGEPAPNLALLIATELGVPGLAAALVIFFGALRAIHGDRQLDVAAAAAGLGLLLLAMVDHYLWTMPLGRVITWAGLALVATRAYPLSKNDSAP
jgi:O-antigen ligase/polysaccharide polymerase Wzy-like membrane protein